MPVRLLSREREAHLQKVRRNQEQRNAAESSEKRDARLQLLRRNQEQIIAAKSSEESERGPPTAQGCVALKARRARHRPFARVAVGSCRRPATL